MGTRLPAREQAPPTAVGHLLNRGAEAVAVQAAVSSPWQLLTRHVGVRTTFVMLTLKIVIISLLISSECIFFSSLITSSTFISKASKQRRAATSAAVARDPARMCVCLKRLGKGRLDKGVRQPWLIKLIQAGGAAARPCERSSSGATERTTAGWRSGKTYRWNGFRLFSPRAETSRRHPKEPNLIRRGQVCNNYDQFLSLVIKHHHHHHQVAVKSD